MTSLTEHLKHAAQVLGASEIADPRREAGSLLALALGKDRTFLIAHPEYELNENEQKLFDQYLQRRAGREPFGYIAGRREFYGLDFIVTPDVLIPRPETELLVETAIGLFRETRNLFFCEIGVGSGCISVSILHELKTARATGFDISQKALDIAEQNAVNNGVAERLELGVSNVFSALSAGDKFDLIVSNPPYIHSEDMLTLQTEVREHEPPGALTDGRDGLSITQNLINESPAFLKPGGYLLIEIGIHQSPAVRKMADTGVWASLDFLPDLQGIPRAVKLQKV